MTPTPPSGTPRLIADQLHRDDGQDRDLRGLRIACAALAAWAVAGALVGVWYVAQAERPQPPPIVHVAAAPPCPACPPCVVACAACPSPAPRHHR